MVIFNSYFDITRGYIHVISSLRSAIASSATSSKSLMVVSKSTKAPGVPVKISATWPKNRWVMKVCGPQQAKHILNKDWMIQLRAVCRSFWWSYSASKTLSLNEERLRQETLHLRCDGWRVASTGTAGRGCDSFLWMNGGNTHQSTLIFWWHPHSH